MCGVCAVYVWCVCVGMRVCVGGYARVCGACGCARVYVCVCVLVVILVASL